MILLVPHAPRQTQGRGASRLHSAAEQRNEQWLTLGQFSKTFIINSNHVECKSVDRYTVFVDVSAKIETWDKNSVVAVSNGHSRTMLFTPEIKMRSAELVRTFSNEPVQFTLLALFTFISIRSELDKIQTIIIDRDYSGEHAERIIKRMLNTFIKRVRPQFKAKAIKIDNIAGSNADKLARETYRGNKTINEVVAWEQIEEVLHA